MPVRLEGWVDNGKGAPLPNISAIVTRVDDGGIVTSGLTDAEGHWVFSGLSELEEYFVNLADGNGNAIVRGPWSGGMREAFVRDRLALPDTGLAVLPNGGNTTVGGLPLVLDPNPANVLEWGPAGIYSAGAVGLTQELADTLYEPIDSAYTKAESDALYEPLDSAYTKAESDARYAELTDVDPFPQYLTPAEANGLYEPFDSAYTKAEADARYTQGGITQAAADLRYEPLDSAYTKSEADARYLQLTGGSVMTGLLGPSTHNTRDLGTTGTRWRALYGMTGDLTTSLTVATKPVAISPDASNIVEWRANGFYAAAGAVSDIWVNTTGDTMTGDLNMTANVLPTVTNTRDLGSTSLRWRKVWAVDAEFTNAPTVGGSALLTATAADALFLTPAEGNTAYATAAHNHDASYVQLAGGSVMTGLLGPTTTNTRDLGTTALRWRKLWAVDGEFTNAPTVGGAALLTQTTADALFLTPAEGNAAYATSAHAHDAAYVNVGGDTMTAPLLLPDGTLAAPAIGFSNDTNNGLRLSSSDAWRLVAGGVDIAQVGAGGLSVLAGNVVTPGLAVNSRPVIMAGCRVYHNANQTITTGTLTALAFNSERYDTDLFHDTVTLNTRLTVPAGMAGKYHITGNVDWNPVADATMRFVGIRVNGTTQIARQSGPNLNSATVNTAQNVSATYDLAVGDYVELVVRHERGSNLDVTTTANFSPEFSLQRIG